MSSKVAIVTGASQGIGRSTAIRLARDFDSIVLVARNRANLEETAIEVKKAGAESLVFDVDLSEADAARQVVDQTLELFHARNRQALFKLELLSSVVQSTPRSSSNRQIGPRVEICVWMARSVASVCPHGTVSMP